MKAWNELLEFIDEYVYMTEDEEIVIRYSEKADAAHRTYKNGLKLAGEDELSKWLYDIALDCVRKMSLEDREYVKKHLYTTEYHFGYAMGIRNTYIHPSKNHRYFEADGVSSSVMRRIFSNVSPFYDYRNARCVNFFESMKVNELINMYGDSYPEIVEKIINEVTSEGVPTAEIDDEQRFKENLKDVLGQDEFIRIFKEAYKYYNENEKQNKRDDWYWNVNFPGVKAILFPLEAKQIRALNQFNYFWYVESGAAKSIADCKKFIDENLGLRDDYAEFMARCGWEACSPYYNGTWGELALYTLDLNYSLKWKLEKQEIKTVGDLCSKTKEELLEIPQITDKEISEIESAVLNWLEERNLVFNGDNDGKSC